MQALHLFHFGDSGPYDALSPFYWHDKEMCQRILTRAITSPIAASEETLTDKSLFTPYDKLIEKMTLVGLLKKKDGFYHPAFPFFLEADLPLIDRFADDVARVLAKEVLQQKEAFYKPLKGLAASQTHALQRLAYHVIGGDVFDGWALDWLSDLGFISLGDTHPNDRRYLLVGFEDTQKMRRISDNLLLSANNATGQHMVFRSFGDANGDRKDFYRLFKLIEKKQFKSDVFKGLQGLFDEWSHDKAHLFMHACETLIMRAYENKLTTKNVLADQTSALRWLLESAYLKETPQGTYEVAVPVLAYDELDACQQTYHDLFLSLVPIMHQTFHQHADKLQALSAVSHGIPRKAIHNELWHQIFGRINEALVAEGFMETPKQHEGGRYLQSILFL